MNDVHKVIWWKYWRSFRKDQVINESLIARMIKRLLLYVGSDKSVIAIDCKNDIDVSVPNRINLSSYSFSDRRSSLGSLDSTFVDVHVDKMMMVDENNQCQ